MKWTRDDHGQKDEGLLVNGLVLARSSRYMVLCATPVFKLSGVPGVPGLEEVQCSSQP